MVGVVLEEEGLADQRGQQARHHRGGGAVRRVPRLYDQRRDAVERAQRAQRGAGGRGHAGGRGPRRHKGDRPPRQPRAPDPRGGERRPGADGLQALGAVGRLAHVTGQACLAASSEHRQAHPLPQAPLVHKRHRPPARAGGQQGATWQSVQGDGQFDYGATHEDRAAVVTAVVGRAKLIPLAWQSTQGPSTLALSSTPDLHRRPPPPSICDTVDLGLFLVRQWPGPRPRARWTARLRRGKFRDSLAAEAARWTAAGRIPAASF